MDISSEVSGINIKLTGPKVTDLGTSEKSPDCLSCNSYSEQGEANISCGKGNIVKIIGRFAIRTIGKKVSISPVYNNSLKIELELDDDGNVANNCISGCQDTDKLTSESFEAPDGSFQLMVNSPIVYH